jgi:hypothetical protein
MEGVILNEGGEDVGAFGAIEAYFGKVEDIAIEQVVKELGIVGIDDLIVGRTDRCIKTLAHIKPAPLNILIARAKAEEAAQEEVTEYTEATPEAYSEEYPPDNYLYEESTDGAEITDYYTSSYGAPDGQA